MSGCDLFVHRQLQHILRVIHPDHIISVPCQDLRHGTRAAAQINDKA